MTAPGTPFESPRACPFVALEQDRDRRSDTPDYNHRCFAEPTPAPRSIAHQEAYCLSPGFAACPVFQDWAVRAAARPLEGSGSSAAVPPSDAAEVDVDHDLADVASEAPVADAAVTAAGPTNESTLDQLPEDASVTPAGAEIAAAAAAITGISPGVASPPTFATTDWQSETHESEQLSAFDAQSANAQPGDAAPPATFNPAWYSQTDDPPRSSYGEPDAGYPVAANEPDAPAPAPFVPPPARPGSAEPAPPAEQAAAVAAPAFLAGRSSRPPTTPGKDDVVPSWDVDGRYGAAPPPQSKDGGGNRLDGVLTAIAVIAILALGVAAVIFLPGLLNKGGASKTPLPSIVIPSGLATSAPSGLFSAPPSVAPSIGPSVAPTEQASQGPVSSPRLYRIKTGDSLAKIANRFGITLQDILDANPDISNPNNIFVGQIIVVPVQVPQAT
jgi:hypothetical protein